MALVVLSMAPMEHALLVTALGKSSRHIGIRVPDVGAQVLWQTEFHA